MKNLAKRTGPAAAFVAALMIAVAVASAGTLDRIGQDKAIRIAYREDAPPFSYKDKLGEASGFMVDLCRAVAKKLAGTTRSPLAERGLCPGHRDRPVRCDHPAEG